MKVAACFQVGFVALDEFPIFMIRTIRRNLVQIPKINPRHESPGGLCSSFGGHVPELHETWIPEFQRSSCVLLGWPKPLA